MSFFKKCGIYLAPLLVLPFVGSADLLPPCSGGQTVEVCTPSPSQDGAIAGKLIPIYHLLNISANAGREIHVTASSYENTETNFHPPRHAYDSNFSTWWSAYGRDEWLQFDFPATVSLDSVALAFHRGNERTANIRFAISNDGQHWTQIFSGTSSGSTTAMELFTFAETSLASFRIVTMGNSANDWNSIKEVLFPSLSEPTCSDGIRNQDEDGIDCGGGCEDICCSNGYEDSQLGETGIDCGGSCSPCYEGTTYYISSSMGNDANNGLTPDSCWQTIEKVNQTELQGGDAVLFRRDDTWREELVISSSGSVDSHITYSAYGSGRKPKLLASEQANGWVAVAGQHNIYRSTSTLSPPQIGSHPASIFFGEKDGSITWGRTLNSSSLPSCAGNYAVLNDEYDWCWDNAVYVYSPESPAVRYNFVEVPQRRGSITMRSHQPQEHITIDGLDLMFGVNYGYNDGWPMNYQVRGLTIRNCHIGYIGIRDAASAMWLVVWHSDLLVQNNDIHDCGRRSISYNIYTDNPSQPDGLLFENVIFENNTLHNGYHTTGFDISHGDARSSILRNFVFRNNLIYDINSDDPNGRIDDYTSMGLYLWTGAARFENFAVYNNVLKNIKQKGIAIGSTSGTHVNLQIYNNVLYGMNPNISDYRAQVHIGGNHEGLRFNNNIMYGTIDPLNYVSRGLYLSGNLNDSLKVASLDYNLYFQEYPSQQILNNYSGSYRMSQWDEYTSTTGWDENS
ncbi:MAG: discoidin domain-containing protein, partial [Desulfopila sp.]|nr:discoidin domain-containing protein [Desulfopila sp.]